ncbi:MAG: hypothetical protein K1000chlam4_00164 [Chlamydiae bacterium]|nr:hypothetical protein [Chlamydiota bacterium]
MNQNLNILEEKTEKALAGETISRKDEIRQIIEALLFSTGEPIALDKIREIVNTTYPLRSAEIQKIIQALGNEYQEQKRGFEIEEIAGGYMLRTVDAVSSFVRQLHQDRRGEKLSRAATETLAIVAYKQPITRAEVEAIRGVDSSGVLSSLLERGLVERVGKLDAPGRPSQYGITKRFLKHFGLKSVQDLVS